MTQVNTVEYYTRQKEEWMEGEVEQLKNEYLNKKLTIMEIGILHRRTPGAIGYKLQSTKIIPTNRDARGYDDYTKSELYQSIVNTSKTNKSEKTQAKGKVKLKNDETTTQESNTTIRQTRNNMAINYADDIKCIKNEIKSIKESINELTGMLKAIYEFEDA